jgi:hypothetical protein
MLRTSLPFPEHYSPNGHVKSLCEDHRHSAVNHIHMCNGFM